MLMNRYVSMGSARLARLMLGLLIGFLAFGTGFNARRILAGPSSFSPSVYPQGQQAKGTSQTAMRPPLFDQKLHHFAASITVKVFSGHTSGSGILIHRQGDLYTIMTNHHVLIFGNPTQNYHVQTPDNHRYRAQLVQQHTLRDYDLGLLQFRTQKTYPVVAVPKVFPVAIGQEVFSAGFPFEADPSRSRGFEITRGNVEMISRQSFGGGYQIGSTNVVKKGMSGGPLLDRKGRLVGINGKHKYPLWGNPYIFADGSKATPSEKQRMSQFSWAIPMQTVVQLVPQFVQQYPQAPQQRYSALVRR